MPTGKTVMGKTFSYSGSLKTGIVVHFRNAEARISAETIEIMRGEITKRSPVKMGANRKPLVADSIGETLYEEFRITPQVMSYVLPLLVEEGFCSVSDGKPFVITRTLKAAAV